MALQIARSALKHGCSAADVAAAWEVFVTESVLADDPRKILRTGFDQSARLLELVGVWRDTGVVIIHAMPARTQYRQIGKGHR